MRRLWVVVGLGVLAGCSSRASRPLPRERPGASNPSTGKPEPEPDSKTYLGEGLASYYGPGLHGRPTASGEKFDQEAMTAAHRKLRFGTCVRVVNMENGRSVQVRVNDRGPFKDERIIDVSLGAARKLDMVKKGLARVRLYRCEEPSSAFSPPRQALPG
ncbi:septal ring lytic transglycosylase RlpA family protein [Hyalangium rubrum]|uniref:Probable endolytic peptidoglycan transglycosylase RlpA n=1 Tax=Hyalangium rubrum TaxID=3103134 RepID=A0ABU5GW03_9BACT|nr:septal ring lytic transglycosylase RlpA family protein [Hyalangium sp. s54d21]MDY7225360.1 septal ring lytic transglycosylase RlpA family protein [Hyalangium sp. s54d21]